MEKTVAGLIGAVGALVAGPAAQAAIVPPATLEATMQAGSYSDLLKPIPNALALRAAFAQQSRIPPAAGANSAIRRVEDHHHHHHHDHHHHHHHDHHHHHNN